MTTAIKSLVSIGKLCGWFNALPDEIRAAAALADVVPVELRNGVVEWYDTPDAERIGEQRHYRRVLRVEDT